MAAPDIDKKMRMEVDALDYATGGVLSMECGDGLWRPVAFLSKSLNETERNVGYHKRIRGMETFAGRGAVQVRNLDRSQELRVLFKSAKVELKAG